MKMETFGESKVKMTEVAGPNITYRRCRNLDTDWQLARTSFHASSEDRRVSLSKDATCRMPIGWRAKACGRRMFRHDGERGTHGTYRREITEALEADKGRSLDGLNDSSEMCCNLREKGGMNE